MALELLQSNSELTESLMRPVLSELAEYVLVEDVTVHTFNDGPWFSEVTQDYTCQIFQLNFTRLNNAKTNNLVTDYDERPFPEVYYMFMNDLEAYGLSKFVYLRTC